MSMGPARGMASAGRYVHCGFALTLPTASPRPELCSSGSLCRVRSSGAHDCSLILLPHLGPLAQLLQTWHAGAVTAEPRLPILSGSQHPTGSSKSLAGSGVSPPPATGSQTPCCPRPGCGPPLSPAGPSPHGSLETAWLSTSPGLITTEHHHCGLIALDTVRPAHLHRGESPGHRLVRGNRQAVAWPTLPSGAQPAEGTLCLPPDSTPNPASGAVKGGQPKRSIQPERETTRVRGPHPPPTGCPQGEGYMAQRCVGTLSRPGYKHRIPGEAHFAKHVLSE